MLYASYLHCPIRKDFFPEILYSTKLEKKLSNPKFYGVLSDKGFLTSLFPGDNTYRMPKSLVYNSYGTFTDGDKTLISENEAIRPISDAGVVIIKPTIDTSSGEGVTKVVINEGRDVSNGLSVKDIFRRYKQNFIVQECVKQSRYLADLCEKSLNKFRVITYICEGKVFHAPLSLRMGNGSSFVDNIHRGGKILVYQMITNFGNMLLPNTVINMKYTLIVRLGLKAMTSALYAVLLRWRTAFMAMSRC